MKKLLSLILALIVTLSCTACSGGSSKALVGEWKNVNDGDVYIFNSDGTGSHGTTSITYRVDKDSVYITEGASSVAEQLFTLDTASAVSKLVPENKSTYYVPADNYEQIAEQIRAENLKILTSYEYWSNTAGLNYIMFQDGGGWFLLSGTTLGLNWEWQDNNTLKLSFTYNGTDYSNVVTLVNVDNSYQLVNDQGVVQYLPKNPLG